MNNIKKDIRIEDLELQLELAGNVIEERDQHLADLESENARLKAALEAVEQSLKSGIQNAKETALHADSHSIYLQANARERALKPILEALQKTLQVTPEAPDPQVQVEGVERNLKERVTLTKSEIDYIAKNGNDGFIAISNGSHKSKNPANLKAVEQRRRQLGL